MKEIRSYIDEDGRRVSALLEVNAETLEISNENVMFNGSFHVGTNMGPMPISFHFPEEYNLKKCFEEFDKFAEKAIDEKNQEIAKENIIAVPNKGGGLIIP